MKILDARTLGVDAVIRAVDRPPSEVAPDVTRAVDQIIADVRARGDAALLEYTARFDGFGPAAAAGLAIPRADFEAAEQNVEGPVRSALAYAAERIERYHAAALPKSWRLTDEHGSVLGQDVRPLERVGIYIPGGRAAYPSTVLMTAVPARVAGVREIIAVCPRPEPAVMAAAEEAGVTRLFRIGGAHAVAALAYGTRTVPRVDKIVGPGNRYVAAAKAIVARTCAIDFYAGPTEIVVVAGGGRADWIAADLVAQAEHDPDARAIFITWNRPLASRVAKAVDRQSGGRSIARRSLSAQGVVVVARDADDAMALANRLASEHLVVDRESLIKQPVTAGAVFVGPYAAQAAGDYATGSNHVLPTSGMARSRGGLSAADFVRVMSVQRVTRAGLARLAETILPLARAEGLDAHAKSIEMRLRH
jgi:histidinol dehydrogenase